MIELFYSPGACSMASHIGIEEIGVPYEPRPTLITKGEQKSEAYLKINPRGKVPALRVDGTVITENVAILNYLAKRFPEKKNDADRPVRRGSLPDDDGVVLEHGASLVHAYRAS